MANSIQQSTSNKKAIKKILIEIGRQELIAIENGKAVFKFNCVTGDAAHPTPSGFYKIIRKERVRRSNKYNAQMNYALQITNDGVFIHEGYNYITNPAEQGLVAAVISDTATSFFSNSRRIFPQSSKLKIGIGNINLIGSHGCIRLSHADAVKLFDWAEAKTVVEIK